MRILAIDPGLDRCGYAIVNISKPPQIIDFGRIETSKAGALILRVKKLGKEFASLIDKFKPGVVVIEEIFFSKNKKTIIMVSQSQGVLLSICAQKNLDVEFINPMQIKLALTGDGRADKKQVQKMLSLEYNLKFETKHDDVSDAIAVGLAYFHLKRHL